MRNKSLGVGLMIVAIALGIYLLTKGSNNGGTTYMNNSGSSDQSENSGQNEYNSGQQTQNPAGSATTSSGNEANPSANAKTFTVSGSEFKFSPGTITVNKGDKVTIKFTNNGTTQHNWTLSGFNAKTVTIPPGQSASVTFTANQTGTFQYYCSVDSHRQQGMVGTLVVR